MSTIEANQEIERRLKSFLRGLTQADIVDRYQTYKSLYQCGADALPHLREAIFKSNWSTVRYPNEIRYVAGLVNLVHDIDESESVKITAELERKGCSTLLSRILKSICSFTVDNFKQYEVCGVRVFEHKQLPTTQNVKRKLEGWLPNCPAKDLSEIDRIYIVRQEELEALGTYRPVLFCITLAWDNPYRRWHPISWMNNFEIERTLYHEVGHHAHRHSFGEDQDQEDAADKYADWIMGHRSNRLLFKLARLIKGTPNDSAITGVRS
jgi:hypothetical protein